ncbi:DUF2804 domain-containing protein [Kistimonas scapharcae]
MNDAVMDLIDDRGRVRTGIFKQPVGTVNYRDFNLKTPMGEKAGKLRRWFGFNQFQFMSIISPDIIAGCAIVDTRLAVVAFLYLYNPKTRAFKNYQFKAPGFGGFHKTSLSPDNGAWLFRSGANEIHMAINPQTGLRELTVRLKDGTAIDMDYSEQNFSPMRICTPADLTGFAFTQKVAGVRCRGEIRSSLGNFDLETVNACATLDWTAGYLRRCCFWNWSCFSGVLDDGRVIGLNGACGVNETSYTENCFWVDGSLNKVDTLIFDYDPANLHDTWHVTSGDGKVDLKFTPEGCQAEKNNFLIMASNFSQMFGRYNGTLTTTDGEVITICDQYGFTEEHYAKW